MSVSTEVNIERIDGGLRAICGIAAYYRIAADPAYLKRELAIRTVAGGEDLLRAAKLIGLKARSVPFPAEHRLVTVPAPAIMERRSGGFVVYGGQLATGSFRLVDPITSGETLLTYAELLDEVGPRILLLARRFGGKGASPTTFNLRWFIPSIWRYWRPLAHVLLASLFIQVFALITPLFFQEVIDKVLSHRSYSTLYVLVAGIVIIGCFDAVLQYLRTYVLSHTTNRIDVELGQRLFTHLMQLPLSYFETRAAGQTVARVRELENIRSFLTGQGLFSILDVVFTFVFIGVLFIYSVPLSLIVLATLPVYVLIGMALRPVLASRIDEKFYRGALSQQFLIESVVGIHTIKSAAVEPIVRADWEERLAGYVRTSFGATMVGAGGQNAIQFVNKLTTAMLMLFGAKAVIDGSLSVGGLVAFNMIAAQVMQPVLRLSQFAQDVQQVRVSVSRLGDVLNTPPEHRPQRAAPMPPPRGAIRFDHVTFRYRPGSPDVLKDVSFEIRPGEVVGVVGASGSGKSTLAKLLQRLYIPQEGQVLLDGSDLSHVDPAWLRSNIGVVLQENLLFNRTIRDNIALAAPAMTDAQVVAAARLAGADAFIARMPEGYETMIEERGSNLSGGQRQRIAIARALATNPPILIFDEATSALDYESERVIQENMRQIVNQRTVVIIAHRLAAVRDCHRIIAMKDGRIHEMGSHAELLDLPGGLYRRLWDLQGEQGRPA